ncbi:MAG: secretin N-terminal domain-containing protein [Candidatus Omnitrophota bacterium]
MKANYFFRVSVFIFALFYSAFLPALNASSEAPEADTNITISMDLQDADLKDILKIFSIQSGLNFIASEAVQDRKITLYLDKVPLEKAMDRLFKANNLSFELDKRANIFVVKDWGKMQVETVTKIFYLKYASVSSSSLKEEMSRLLTSVGEIAGVSSASGAGATTASTSGGSGESGKWTSEEESGITPAVKKLLSEYGSVIEDYRTNSLIITDTPKRMGVIEQVIAALDVSIPQVLLEVEMLDVSKNAVDTLGFEFGSSPFTAVLSGATGAVGFPFHSWFDFIPSTSGENGSLAINTGDNTYQVQLDFLRTLTDTKFLARPRLLTLNNETAEIKIATNESVGVKTITEATSGSTQAEPERAETGVILRVTPQINPEKNEITMIIYPKVSEAAQGNSLTSNGQTFQFRDPEERSTKSIVRVKDGDTVVLGGLIRTEKTEVITKLPFLGDIPVLGALFRHKNKSKDRDRELLVFITPRIIKEANIKLAQSNKVNIPAREQNTATGFDREMAINSSLQNFEYKGAPAY